MPDVQWPYAFLDTAPIHIRGLPDAFNGHLTCVDCAERVVPKRGPERAWHYAHYALNDASINCGQGESVLHKSAKFAISEALSLSRLEGTPFILEWRCPGARCKALSSVDISVMADHAEVESVVLKNVRPDVLLSQGGTPVMAIEVFVSNAVTRPKVAMYEAHGIPYVEIKATVGVPDEARELRKVRARVVADWWAKGTVPECAECVARNEERARAGLKATRRVQPLNERQLPLLTDVDPELSKYFNRMAFTEADRVMGLTTRDKLIKSGFTPMEILYMWVKTVSPDGVEIIAAPFSKPQGQLLLMWKDRQQATEEAETWALTLCANHGIQAAFQKNT